jgi:hypothetical protein
MNVAPGAKTTILQLSAFYKSTPGPPLARPDQVVFDSGSILESAVIEK